MGQSDPGSHRRTQVTQGVAQTNTPRVPQSPRDGRSGGHGAAGPAWPWEHQGRTAGCGARPLSGARGSRPAAPRLVLGSSGSSFLNSAGAGSWSCLGRDPSAGAQGELAPATLQGWQPLPTHTCHQSPRALLRLLGQQRRISHPLLLENCSKVSVLAEKKTQPNLSFLTRPRLCSSAAAHNTDPGAIPALSDFSCTCNHPASFPQSSVAEEPREGSGPGMRSGTQR